MAIKIIEKDGKIRYRIYAQARAYIGDQRVKRLQKLLTFKSKNEAIKAEKFWTKEIVRQARRLEGKGLYFKDIVFRFMTQARYGYLGKKISEPVLKEHESKLNRFCSHWFDTAASDINRGDVREVIRKAKANGASYSLQKKIKTTINMIFNWAIEEKLVQGMTISPAHGLVIEKDDDKEKVPAILTLDEVKLLLKKAKEKDHPWYPIWAFALLTGMRSGELYALKWSCIDLNQNNIRVEESFCFATKRIKGTKSGYWRNVPISNQLRVIIEELKNTTENEEFVLPRESGWLQGEAAKVLRNFLKSIGINTPVVFHTLRACFATHLLALGVESAKIMKIGGWKDLKTFEIYVRLAGIQVKGVTDKLDLLSVP